LPPPDLFRCFGWDDRKQKYDFTHERRGRIAAPEPQQRGKTRITIRLDEDLVDHFLREAEASGRAVGNQTLINDALRQHVDSQAAKLEDKQWRTP
jgi:uncharacterized protein (DUF4415 family)